jgi:protein-disulfide isomerase/uncharacterized membrane protein
MQESTLLGCCTIQGDRGIVEIHTAGGASGRFHGTSEGISVPRQTGRRDPDPAPQGRIPSIRVSGAANGRIAAVLAAAIVLSGFLIAKHFGGGLPGCGPKSGCDALEATRWGMLPGIRWPVSFAGGAYFVALLAGLLVSRRELPFPAIWLLRAGVATSLFFIALMLALGKVCSYCAGIHTANLTALLMTEVELRRSIRRTKSGGPFMTQRQLFRGAAVAGSAFLAVSLVLGVADARYEQQQRVQAEGERRASTDEIMAQAQAPDEGRIVDMWGRSGFTGRYRLGPESCPVRVVMLTDYQCPDCRRIEAEIEAILAARQDVSLSIKHFPMCAEASPGVPCNRYAKTTMHPNACWAARAAEAAGILKGDEGFWEMHRWLFGRAGTFTDADLKTAVAQMGYDPGSFVAVMSGAETLRRVQSDCEEGIALGLYFTPMIFVNGVEFKGWQIPGALKQTIDEVTAKHPPSLTASADRPALALQKYVTDWREQALRAFPADRRAWSIGTAPTGARAVDIVLFGDYQEPYTAAMDIALRDYIQGKSGIRYTFRHYPIDPSSNPALPAKLRPEAVHPLAGKAARAAEAAGSLGGSNGYWKMHDWLMRNQKAFADETLGDAVKGMGLDPAKLLAEMQNPEVAEAITEDARAAQALGLTNVPMVFVNGRVVPRTTREKENIVIRIIEEVRKP